MQQTLDLIQRALAGGRNVGLRNFGVLEVPVRRPRNGRNPNRPGETVGISLSSVQNLKQGLVRKRKSSPRRRPPHRS